MTQAETLNNGQKRTVVWTPNSGPQSWLMSCPADEIFFGGSRGGGKTDGMLGKHAIKAQEFASDVIGIFFRRTFVDLKEVIQRSKKIYGPLGARYHKSDKEWLFPNGARLKFAYLDNDDDADNYQGHNYTDVYFEELGHWPSDVPIRKLKATLRSGAKVPCQFHATGNPGGPGAAWIKQRYIDPAPLGMQVKWEVFENPFTGAKVRKSRIFIPSSLQDNPHLGSEYVANLQQSGSEALVRAWLLGDWSAIEGAYFSEFSTRRHVLRPCQLPAWWTRFRSMDWGSARPFSVHWWAVAGEEWQHPDGQIIPRGAMIAYREWYGASAPNVGLKMTANAVGKQLRLKEKGDALDPGASVIDPAAFNQDGGPSIAERLFDEGVMFRRADNKRTGKNGGWDMLRQRLVGDDDGRSMIYLFSTCTEAIRTIPMLQHDKTNAEDLDTDGEDHAADEIRYAVMSRPWSRTKPKTDVDVFKEAVKPLTYDDMHKARQRRMNA